MITAPFNFVPLNKEVFYPDWAETISHDVPFEDGESGIIDIKISSGTVAFQFVGCPWWRNSFICSQY